MTDIIVGDKTGVRTTGTGGLPFWFFYDSTAAIDRVSGVAPTTPANVITWPLSSLPDTLIGLQGQGADPAIGELQVYFTTNFNQGAQSGNMGLVSANASDAAFLYLNATSNQVTVTDGTNTSSISITPASAQIFRVRLIHGNIPELGGTMMALILDEVGANGELSNTVSGTAVTFAGEFQVGVTDPDFELGRGTPNITINDVLWFKSPTTHSLLMFQGAGFQYGLQAEIG